MSVTARPARRPSRYIAPMNNVIERKQPATLADLERRPLDGSRAELIDGTLYVTPGAGFDHQGTSDAILVDLYQQFFSGRGAQGGWWIISNPVLELSSNRVLIPDLGGWRVERLPGGLTGKRSTVTPDWVAEVRSPSTATHDALRKGPLYRQAGVEWFWIVDPAEGFVEIYRADGDLWHLDRIVQAHESEARLPPFEAVPIDVRRWFGLSDER
jgi:Uma2 family endonuclease